MNDNIPQTIAIIMDGNGRWAKQRGLPRTAGHKQGADTIRTVALAANELGVKVIDEETFIKLSKLSSKEEVLDSLK